jgi:hypothetical protein
MLWIYIKFVILNSQLVNYKYPYVMVSAFSKIIKNTTPPQFLHDDTHAQRI